MFLFIKRIHYIIGLLVIFATHSFAVDKNNITANKTVTSSFISSNNDHLWFEQFKKNATDKQLYHFLYNMPKGGDLHHHSSGSHLPKWWYELALNKEKNGGYTYFTRTHLNICNGYGKNEFGMETQTLMFRTISGSSYNKLNECEKNNYTALNKLNNSEIESWKKSIWLDKPHEGRDEFFQTHWQRLNELTANPFIAAEMLVKNMESFGKEGLLYIEAQLNATQKYKVDGSPYTQEEALNIYIARLSQPDAIKTGVTVRLQYALLRFLPNAEQALTSMYDFVDKHRNIYVGINMVGREDNPKGHPLRFLPTLKKLRSKYPAINLAIHAGESEAPNFNIRDTLLLGAKRIGHGINLLSDPQTLLLMRNNDYLIEINLISNLKLGYVADLNQHPFPEFLRLGIPVALSTDDRGMWHSNMTDEFFIGVKYFNLSWSEITSLSKNSLSFSFLDAKTKKKLLKKLDNNILEFEKNYKHKGEKSLKKRPVFNEFILSHSPTVAG
ncbi:adenosine deaminase family protein [Colwellia sp. RE-S-Sl-9]